MFLRFTNPTHVGYEENLQFSQFIPTAGGSVDVRQRRSQERLHAAVLRLAAERSVSELSVTELAVEAGVHRSTFYEHAASPADLLQAALVAELDVLRARLYDEAATDVDRVVGEVTEDVLRHVERHAAVYRRGLGAGSGSGSLHAMLSGHFRESSRRLLELARLQVGVQVPGVPDEVVADLAVRFVADGTVGIIEGWLAQPEPRVEDFMELYLRLLPAWWPSALSARVT